jgi:hypothetical protein
MIPIFIGGCARSGTTLLGAMLGVNNLCITVPESQFKIEAIRSQKISIDKIDVLEAAKYIKNNIRYKYWKLDIDPVSIVKSKKTDFCYSDLIKELVINYAVVHGKSNPKYWVDHTPENIKYVSMLLNVFPEAKFIHLVRDGRAVAASVMPLKWGPNTVNKASNWWVERVSYGLGAEEYLRSLGIPVLRVRYEDILLTPEKQMKDICEFLNIEYSEAMLKSDGFVVPSNTLHQHKLIGEKPDLSRLDAWKSTLSMDEIGIFESIVCDMLIYLGYEPASELNPIEDYMSIIHKMQVKDFLKRMRRNLGQLIPQYFIVRKRT